MRREGGKKEEKEEEVGVGDKLLTSEFWRGERGNTKVRKRPFEGERKMLDLMVFRKEKESTFFFFFFDLQILRVKSIPFFGGGFIIRVIFIFFRSEI